MIAQSCQIGRKTKRPYIPCGKIQDQSLKNLRSHWISQLLYPTLLLDMCTGSFQENIVSRGSCTGGLGMPLNPSSPSKGLGVKANRKRFLPHLQFPSAGVAGVAPDHCGEVDMQIDQFGAIPMNVSLNSLEEY